MPSSASSLVRLPCSSLFPYTTLFRSSLLIASVVTTAILGTAARAGAACAVAGADAAALADAYAAIEASCPCDVVGRALYLDCARAAVDRKSTRLNSSHLGISYAVFCFIARAPPVLFPLSLHDALPIFASHRFGRHHGDSRDRGPRRGGVCRRGRGRGGSRRRLRGDRGVMPVRRRGTSALSRLRASGGRSEEHTSELQSLRHLVCRLLLHRSCASRALPSFPTRRSSDLRFSSLRSSPRRFSGPRPAPGRRVPSRARTRRLSPTPTRRSRRHARATSWDERSISTARERR